MELRSKMPSALLNEEETDVNLKSTSDDIQWDKEISLEEAYKALEGKFYGFKKVMAIYSSLFKQFITVSFYNQTLSY